MSIYNFSVLRNNGEEESLDKYRGQVVLIVNTASKCGFTEQYKGLEALYQKYKSQGFVILGFPCNQFGKQEPGSNSDIAEFCELNFGVTFPLFAKVDVNGKEAAPLFEYLKSQAKGVLGSTGVKWNFTKFLVAKDGSVIDRFAPTTKPLALETEIEKALAN